MRSANMDHGSDNQADSLASAIADTMATPSSNLKVKRGKSTTKKNSTAAVTESNAGKVTPEKVAKLPKKGTFNVINTPKTGRRKTRAVPEPDVELESEVEPEPEPEREQEQEDGDATETEFGPEPTIPQDFQEIGQPYKLPGPKPPSPIQIAISGKLNAEMMDRESGVLQVLERTGRLARLRQEDPDYVEALVGDSGEEGSTFSDTPKIKVEDPDDPTGGKTTLSGRPYDKNGRFHGRKLVMWHRPRMIEKLILHIQYECHRRGIIVPWDHIVHRLNPGSSGSTAMQHLNKLRDILVVEGHMVPPLLGKVTVKQDPSIRGFVRDMSDPIPDPNDSEQKVLPRLKTDTRVVRWDEPMEDPKKSLVDVEIVRGSGNYRKAPGAQGMDKVPKTRGGERRNRLPAELQEQIEKNQQARGKRNGPKRSRSVANSLHASSIDPAELQSDGEYDPSLKKKRKLGLRNITRKSMKVESDSENDEFDERVEPFKNKFETPIKNQVSTFLTPPKSSLSIKFRLPSSVLSKFPAGEQGAVVHNTFVGETSEAEAPEEADDQFYDHSNDNLQNDDYEDVKDAEEDDLRAKASQCPLNKLRLSYQGKGEHGTLAQYMTAVKEGIDPKVNGTKCIKQRQEAANEAKGEAGANEDEDDEEGLLVDHESERLAPGGGLPWLEDDDTYSNDLEVRHMGPPGYSARYMDGVLTPPHGASAQDTMMALSQADSPPYDTGDDGAHGFADMMDAPLSDDDFGGVFADKGQDPIIVDGNSIPETESFPSYEHGGTIWDNHANYANYDDFQRSQSEELEMGYSGFPSVVQENEIDEDSGNNENDSEGDNIVTQWAGYPSHSMVIAPQVPSPPDLPEDEFLNQMAVYDGADDFDDLPFSHLNHLHSLF